MAMTTLTTHLCMEFNYPTGPDGFRNYGAAQQWEPTVWGFKPSDSEERIYVGPRTITVEVPDDFNPIPQQVAALEREKAEALAKYQASVASINERLSKLLAITHEA